MIKALFRIYRRSPDRVRKFFSWIALPVRLAVRLFVKKITCRGYVQHLDFSDNASFKYYSDRGNYEKSLLDCFLGFVSVNPSSVVVDVGGNYGTYTLAAANIGRYGLVRRIFVFEPDPRPFRALKRSIIENRIESLVSPWNVLCGDESGIKQLLQSERSSASNRAFSSSEESLKFKGHVDVPCVRIDDVVLREISIKENVFIIKIDIEGNELRAFRGMHEVLNQAKGIVLQFEYQPMAIREVGLDLDEFRAFISALEFDHAFVTESGKLKKMADKAALFKVMTELDGQINQGFNVAEDFVIVRAAALPLNLTDSALIAPGSLCPA